MRRELMQYKQHFTNVPNNAEGKEFIRLLNKYLNTSTYKAVRRGRGKRTHEGQRYFRDIPARFAERFSIYLIQKYDPKWKLREKLMTLYSGEVMR